LHNSQDNCKLAELLHLEGIEARYQELVVNISKALAKWSQAAPQVTISLFNAHLLLSVAFVSVYKYVHGLP
jgi:hypothetical protein